MYEMKRTSMAMNDKNYVHLLSNEGQWLAIPAGSLWIGERAKFIQWDGASWIPQPGLSGFHLLLLPGAFKL